MTRRKGGYYVAEELQREILLRLPVKSLLRFRSVDKRLRHLISTQPFITDHLKTFRCEENAQLLLLQLGYNNFLWILYHDGVIPKRAHIICIRPPYEIANYGIQRTVGYCNGVACLICKNRSTYEVMFLNPSIRKVVAISALHHLSPDISFWSFGFGYVEGDYKLYALPCTSHSRDAPFTAKVFSLKTRNWASIAFSWPQRQYPQHQYWKIASKHHVFLDGACHWLAKEFNYGSCTTFVLSFYDHTINKIVLPRNLSNEHALSIHVYKGCLSLIVRNHDLWVMNKCGADTSWTKLIEGIHFKGSYTKIIGFSSGGGIVYSRQSEGVFGDELVCYNPTTKTNVPLMEGYAYGLSSADRLHVYRQNLVLLDQDVQIRPGEVSC